MGILSSIELSSAHALSFLLGLCQNMILTSNAHNLLKNQAIFKLVNILFRVLYRKRFYNIILKFKDIQIFSIFSIPTHCKNINVGSNFKNFIFCYKSFRLLKISIKIQAASVFEQNYGKYA